MNLRKAAIIATAMIGSAAGAQTTGSYYGRAWLMPANGSPAPVPTPTPTPTPSADWTFCSEQGTNSYCNVPNGAEVRYGNPADNSWITKSGVTGQILCWPTGFGGDPYYGGTKHCEIRGGSGVVQPPSPQPTWNFCSEQDPGTYCTPPYATKVRYGIEPNWIVKDVSTKIQCWPDGFGGDPASGIRKHCEFLVK